jgi:serine/threonine protein kinase
VSWFPEVGDTVGGYRITGVLGHGGMGVVFSAVPEDLDRPVALKVLAPHAALDPRLRERFRREAETLARLDSPHIVFILEYGEHQGVPYLVTQLVPSGDLRRHLQQGGPLTPRRAADVVAQVAAALEEAHSHGIVHRDLKAANVLLRALPDGELHAFLCDFGIARGETDETTSASGLLGTLEYLAPERQSGAPASVATDVYSLGCLLWAALTGAPPYRGNDVDVAMAHLRAPVPQLPADDPVSRRANAVLARAMAKEPKRRYVSAREMREELVGLRELATEAELLAGPSPRTRRSRRTALAVVLCVATVATLTSLAFGLRDEEPAAPRSSVSDASSSPPATPSVSLSPVRCWNGRIAEETAACPTPSGREGLLWVYPSFKTDQADCRRIPDLKAREKVLAYFCPFTVANPLEGIRYSEWQSAAAAHEAISRDFHPWPEQDVAREGYTWSLWIRASSDEGGRFSTALAYRDWPFSAEVVSNTARAVRLACNFVEQRSPRTFEPVGSLCLPAG